MDEFALHEEVDSISDALIESYSEAFPEVRYEDIEPILNWKYLSELNRGTYWTLQNTASNEIVAGYGIIQTPLNHNHSIGIVGDVFTSPRHQRKGIFTKIGALVFSPISAMSYSLSIGFPIRPEVIPGHLKVGWHVEFEMPVYVAPSALITFRGILGKSNGISFRVVHGSTVSPEEFAYLNLRNGAKAEGLNTIYTESYLSWRLSRPNTDYIRILAFKNECLLGWVVARKIKLKGISTLAILEIETSKDNSDLAKKLIGRIGRLAFRNKCLVVSGCWNQSNFASKSLPRHTFIKTPFTQKVIMRTHNDNLNAPSEMNSKLSWLHSDAL